MAALSRIAASIHRKIAIKPGDVVIFSSRPIPGNEKSVSKVINELSQKGAKVIIQDTHVSGHACEEEIKLIYSLVKPKFSIPVHGEYRHLRGQAEVAQKMGVPKENIKILRSGDILELREDRATIVGKTIAQGIMVDGLGIGDVGNIVLRDRQALIGKWPFGCGTYTGERIQHDFGRAGYCIPWFCLCQRGGKLDG